MLAVDGTRRLDYSAIFGLGNESYGTENFGGALPVKIEALLAEMVKP